MDDEVANRGSCLGALWTVYMLVGLIACLFFGWSWGTYLGVGVVWFLGMCVLGI